MRRRLLATVPLIALLCLVLGLVAAYAAPPAPVTDLRAQSSGTGMILTWTHTDATADHYELWRSDTPYAMPGTTGMVKVVDVWPGALDEEVTYPDTASAIGNVSLNVFSRCARSMPPVRRRTSQIEPASLISESSPRRLK